MLAVPERVKVVLSMLERAAEAGDNCPNNATIAAAIGSPTISAGANIISLLETMGIITVERSRCARVVRINRTGKRTAGVISKPADYSRAAASTSNWTGWTPAKDAVLMESAASGLDFEQSAAWVGCDTEIAAARFDELCTQIGWQAA